MMRRIATSAVAFSCLLGCSLRTARTVKVRVLVPPPTAQAALAAASLAPRLTWSGSDCVFVNVYGPPLASTVANSPIPCWVRAQVSNLVWRGGSTDPISVPMDVVPGPQLTIQVLSVTSGLVNSVSCSGLPDPLTQGGQVSEYGKTVTDVYAGSTIDIYPGGSGGTLANGCGAATLQSVTIAPLPNVMMGGVRNLHAIGYFNDSSTQVLSGASWSLPVGGGLATINSAGQLFGGTATGAIQVAVDVAGFHVTQNGLVTNPNIYIADQGNDVIRKVTDPDLNIHTVAGLPLNSGYQTADDGIQPAVNAAIGSPNGVVADKFGNVFLSDSAHHVVRRVDGDTGIITTFAGSGSFGSSGDGGTATSAQLNTPEGLALAPNGDLYIADRLNHRIRRVSANTGIIDTVIGSGSPNSVTGTGTGASIHAPSGLAFDSAGNLFLSESLGDYVDFVDTAFVLSHVIGTGGPGNATSSPMTAIGAPLTTPRGLAYDHASGDLYVADSGNNKVERLASGTGMLYLFAGSSLGSAGTYSDGGGVSVSFLSSPMAVAVGGGGDVFVADQGSATIARVNGAFIHLFAGTIGSAGYVDGLLANTAKLNLPMAISLGQ